MNLAEIHYWQIFSRVKVSASKLWPADPVILFVDQDSGSDGKASAYNVGDLDSIPELGRSPGEGNGNPLQYSCLENPMDRGAWRATVHGVAKNQARLRDFKHFYPVVTVKNPRLLGAGSMVNTTDVCDQMIKLGKPKRKAFDVEGKG